MEKLFINIFQMSISASYLILAVLFVRFLLRKAPKAMRSFLWLMVGIRLLIPFSVESVFSLIPDTQVADEYIYETVQPEINTISNITSTDTMNSQPISGTLAPSVEKRMGKTQIAVLIGTKIWLTGMVLMFGYLLTSWLRLKNRVKMSVPVNVSLECGPTGRNQKIYQNSGIDSPFLFGIIKPRIYIPNGIADEELPYVVWHEMTHLKRRDYLIKPAGFILLSVYWFNPCVWMAYLALCKDIELICDEKVVRQLGASCKKAYSQALLNCAADRRVIAACPVAFGEVGVKERVKNVLNYKKPAFWVLVAAVLACVIVPVCFMTQKKTDIAENKDNPENAAEQSDSLSEAFSAEDINIETLFAGSYEMPESAMQQLEKDLDACQSAMGTSEKAQTAYQTVEQWAQAFCDRDGSTIVKLADEKAEQNLVNRELLQQGFDGGKDYVAFGWSSPWPWGADDDGDTSADNYRILNVTDRYAEILYYAWVSDPHVTVWREQLTFEMRDGECVITSETLQYMDYICTAEEFQLAYPDGITGTVMDYSYNGAGEALNDHAKNNRDSQWYNKLFEPDSAAIYLLNILNNPNKVGTRVRESATDAGARAVVFDFYEDGSSVSVQMVQPYGSDGIWVPWTDPFDVLKSADTASIAPYMITTQNMDYTIAADAKQLEALFPAHHGSIPNVSFPYSVDLNGDGVKEMLNFTDLGYSGGDGGYSLTVTDTKTGEKISLPDGYTEEYGFPIRTFYSMQQGEEGRLLVQLGEGKESQTVAEIMLDPLYYLYERKNLYVEFKRVLPEQSGVIAAADALSGCSIVTYDNEENPVVLLKTYVQGFLGHIDTLGYVITELRLQEDNTWASRHYFLLDSCR